MDFAGKTVVITGGASGIGAALAQRFVDIEARVCLCDLGNANLDRQSRDIGCIGFAADVTVESDMRNLVSHAEEHLGPIDIFVSNAGIIDPQPDHAASASDAVWMRNWSVHVMAHVYAARILLPGMIARRSGYFVNVASAAGLLNQIGNSAYSATKHAAVSFSESLVIEHGEEGIGVSVVCPQYVATPLLGLQDVDADAHEGLLTADEVAVVILQGIAERRFMILPHPQVHAFAKKRSQDHDLWIKGMQKLRRRAKAKSPDGTEPLYRLD